MATRTDEIERKYEGARVGTDLFAGLPGVAEVLGPDHQTLDATYYDTADMRLALAGITVRRRVGGHDEGWHAKLPVGPDTRREVHVPLDRAVDEVPEELATLVLAHVGERPLRRCARIVTERDVWRPADGNGTVLAEVADDTVRAQALGDHEGPVHTWHEVEVELAEGGRDVLSALERRLTEVGAAPSHESSKLARTLDDRWPRPRAHKLGRRSSGGAVVLAYLRAQVERLRAADLALRLGDEDGVHDMRVAVRRLRSCLRVFGAIVDADSTRALAAELKWLSDTLGDARDAEVLLADLSARVADVPTELVLGPVRAEIDRHLARRVADADQALRTAMDGPRYLEVLAALDDLLADPPYRDLAHRRAVRVLPPLVARAYRKTRKAARAAARSAGGPERDAALHKVRRSVKRLRYAAEAVTPVVGAPAERYRRRCKKVQRILGDHHDLVAVRPVLRELGVQAHLDGTNGFTFGLLHGHADSAAAREEQRFPDAWRKLAKGGARKWMRG
jgi:CHAD domain-containing protein